MKLIKQTEQLYRTRADGGTQYWQGFVYEDNGNFCIIKRYKNGEDGAVVESEPRWIKGKNIGKANETSLKEQAWLELQSRVKQKFDKGYAPQGETAKEFIKPMLAKKFEESKAIFPCKIEPKIDGCRALYIPEKNQLVSRQQKVFNNLDHILNKLKAIDYVLDGELVLPFGFSFQDTVAAIKKVNDNTPLLKYVIYDIVSEEPYYKRHDQLKHLFEDYDLTLPLELIPGYIVDSISSLKLQHESNVKEGYEGSIIRNLDAPYEQKRSKHLLKLKDTLSDEFKIVDVKLDSRSAAYFVCEKNNPLAVEPTFEVCPVGSIEERKNKDYLQHIGKLVTVRYYNLTDDYAPKFANAIQIRDYE